MVPRMVKRPTVGKPSAPPTKDTDDNTEKPATTTDAVDNEDSKPKKMTNADFAKMLLKR